jgi:hypothetical protein
MHGWRSGFHHCDTKLTSSSATPSACWLKGNHAWTGLSNIGKCRSGTTLKEGSQSIAFNFAGFEPGTFFKTVTYNAAPIEADVGFTYRFQRTRQSLRSGAVK